LTIDHHRTSKTTGRDSSNWSRTIEITKLNLDGSTHSQTSERNLSSEQDSIVVASVSTVVLQINCFRTSVQSISGISWIRSISGRNSRIGASRPISNCNCIRCVDISGSDVGENVSGDWYFLDVLLEALSRDSEVVLLADGGDEGEGTAAVSGNAKISNVDGEDISGEPEVSRVGVGSVDGVGVDAVEGGIDPDVGRATTVLVAGEGETSQSVNSISGVRQSHVVLVVSQSSTRGLGGITLLNGHCSVEGGHLGEDVAGRVGES
jgi:hypothetical protein